MEINLNNVRLLVESTPGMGDLIMLTPALRELKNQFPECEITIMSHPGNLKMVDRLPYVSRVCPIDKSVTGILKTARLLHQQDIIVFTTWQSLYARMLKFLRVSFCAGVCKEKIPQAEIFSSRLTSFRLLWYTVSPPIHCQSVRASFRHAIVHRRTLRCIYSNRRRVAFRKNEASSVRAILERGETIYCICPSRQNRSINSSILSHGSN